jgi:hypothetical protein
MSSKREPLMTRAKVTAAISGLSTLCVTLGVLPQATADQLSGQAQLCIAAGATLCATVPTLVHALISRKWVTPTDDPRNDAGELLVPEGSAAAEPSVAAALEAAAAILPATQAPA